MKDRKTRVLPRAFPRKDEHERAEEFMNVQEEASGGPKQKGHIS